MDATLLVFFVVGCLLAAVGALVTFLLTDKPRTLADHVSSLGRLMIFGGALFSGCRAVWNNTQPWAEMTLFVTGIGILTCLYAWRNYKAALAAEGGHEWWEPIRSLLDRIFRVKRPDDTSEHSGA